MSPTKPCCQHPTGPKRGPHLGSHSFQCCPCPVARLPFPKGGALPSAPLGRTQPLGPSVQLLQLGVCGAGLPLLSGACLIGPLIFMSCDLALRVYFSTAKCFGTFLPFAFIFLYVFFEIAEESQEVAEWPRECPCALHRASPMLTSK